MAEESKFEAIASQLNNLNLHERRELKSILDELVSEDRKKLFHSPYEETLRQLKRGVTYESDITLLESRLQKKQDELF